MLRRFMRLSWLIALPLVLVGCPDEDQDIGDEIEEGIEEIEDEIDDAF